MLGRRGFLLLVAGVLVVAIGVPLIYVLTWDAWPRDAILVPQNVGTLQQALEGAEPGAVIVLDDARGPFLGPIVIAVPNLELTSRRGGAVILGGGETAIRVRADGVRIDGLVIDDADLGLSVEGYGCSVSRLLVRANATGLLLQSGGEHRIDDVRIDGGRIGVMLQSSVRNVLTSLDCSGTTEAGFSVRNSQANVLEHVVVAGAPTGISFQDSNENVLSDFRVEDAETVGCEVIGGERNQLVQGDIAFADVGLVCRDGVGVDITECQIEDVAAGGVSLERMKSTRLEQNVIKDSSGYGIRVIGGGDNAIVDQFAADCAGPAIHVSDSSGNLLARNRIERSQLGLQLDRSSSHRVLRNAFDNCGLISILIDQGDAHLLLDNRIEGAVSGLVLSGSIGSEIRRNEIARCASNAVAVIHGAQDHVFSENVVRGSGIGVLVDSSSRIVITDNRMCENGAGLRLRVPGVGVQIQGNSFSKNEVGVTWDDAPMEPDLAFSALGIGGGPSGGGGSPVLVDNRFLDNVRFDILNATPTVLFAGGNWWGTTGDRSTAAAKVSANVYLPATVWRGTLAVGSGDTPLHLVWARTLELALTDAGYRIVDLVGMNGTRAMERAFAEGDVDLLCWVGDETPAVPVDTFFEWRLPGSDRWVVVASELLAARLQTPSLSVLQNVVHNDALRIAVARQTPAAVVEILRGPYALSPWITDAESVQQVETWLKFGSVDAGLVRSIEETVTSAGYVLLDDDLGRLPEIPLRILSRRGGAVSSNDLAAPVDALLPLLTETALHAMVSRVRLLHRDPLDVAVEFLVRQGRIAP